MKLGTLGKVYKKEDRATYVEVQSKDLIKAIELLRFAGIFHVSSVSGRDTGKEIEMLYAFLHEGNYIILKTKLGRSKPVIPTIIKHFPGAKLFERETAEFLGIKFVGNEKPEHVFLTEDSPKTPLRKR